MIWNERVDISKFIGETFEKIEATDESINFLRSDGTGFRMYHSQDCCESVYVESIVGDIQDLVGSPILKAEECDSSNQQAIEKYQDSYTWTFYKIATIKGYVDIRWYGTSNGYYSESVDIERIEGNQ